MITIIEFMLMKTNWTDNDFNKCKYVTTCVLRFVNFMLEKRSLPD